MRLLALAFVEVTPSAIGRIPAAPARGTGASAIGRMPSTRLGPFGALPGSYPRPSGRCDREIFSATCCCCSAWAMGLLPCWSSHMALLLPCHRGSLFRRTWSHSGLASLNSGMRSLSLSSLQTSGARRRASLPSGASLPSLSSPTRNSAKLAPPNTKLTLPRRAAARLWRCCASDGDLASIRAGLEGDSVRPTHSAFFCLEVAEPSLSTHSPDPRALSVWIRSSCRSKSNFFCAAALSMERDGAAANAPASLPTGSDRRPSRPLATACRRPRSTVPPTEACPVPMGIRSVWKASRGFVGGCGAGDWRGGDARG
mmetsp:Transcript_48368/g.113623  ORF Transcript_48368/g.113623 Transcript_48368/m.113623 type:complete len:313 (-) Transcript_48368:441-1379(-)